MAWERILSGCRIVFLTSAAALCAGWLMILPALIGWSVFIGLSGAVETLGAWLMGVGAVTGGASGLILMTSRATTTKASSR